ncbi:hypothetical protein GCK32_000688 [Trichostrongylus colubriformis]|uniref:Peptidase A2 domain-containing protein n=1 Tax=Trichostrongylus colubriformis TaxID=6319 RepID=A0AAN8ITD7_TRICO
MSCGEANHMASTCTKGACRICHQRGHHTSICRQADPSTDKESTHFRKKVVTATQSHNPPPQRKTRQNFVSSTSNEDDDNNDDNVETVVCMKSTTTGATAKECVLVGEAQVFNAETQALETIHILLDTGADRSFIREDLVRRLQLKNTDTLRMSVNTFGSQQSKELVCGITNLQLFDCSGQPHWFRVARIPHITEKLQRSHLTLEDKHYLAENLKLSVSQNSPEVCPEVLLGCSDAFSLIDKQERQTSKTLPSGLRLIPSLLGYLITGPTNDYTPNTAVTKTTTSVTHDKDSRKWDEFLALQTSGIEEFVGTKTQEKEMENEEIWEKFKATIEHHADGYHSDVKLAVFADASKRAMAACAYVVATNTSHLVFARSKLAQAKGPPTVPKMEMHAVTMAVRMAPSAEYTTDRADTQLACEGACLSFDACEPQGIPAEETTLLVP